MCGINGIIGRDEERVKRMNEATRHRGPDGTGIFVSDDVTLGHNLLAITDDPNSGRQPFVSPDETYALAYNGEMYNYEELKKELEGYGDRFSTRGDTEVLFKGLTRFGGNFLHKLDGMFALAFYDRKKGTLLLARDTAGIKPIHTAMIDGRLAFSSEIRGLLSAGAGSKLDIEAAQMFFLMGYVPGRKTLFAGISKLAPGEAATIDIESGEMKKERYTEGFLPAEASIEHSPKRLREVLGDSAKRHTMGLRPFGLFLSGGMDSTALLHELSLRVPDMIRTYTTRFEAKDPSINEDADLAARLANEYRIDHHEFLVREKDFIDAVVPTIQAMEEPRYNHSTPAYWLLTQEAAKDIVVLLDGTGGDELFLGYPKYLNARNIARRYERWPKTLMDLGYGYKEWTGGLMPWGHIASLSDPTTLWMYINKIMPVVGNRTIRKMGRANLRTLAARIRQETPGNLFSPLDKVSGIAMRDRYYWLADEAFLRTDKIAMHFGLEGRFPFLARDVVRYAESMSAKERMTPSLKRPMREAYEGTLPPYITGKRKSGWNAPVAEWMNGEFGAFVREVLSKEYYMPTNELFDLHALQKDTLRGVSVHSLATLKQFLPIFFFQVWAREFKITP